MPACAARKPPAQFNGRGRLSIFPPCYMTLFLIVASSQAQSTFICCKLLEFVAICCTKFGESYKSPLFGE